MDYTIFADESGTSPADKCFSIGSLAVPTEQVHWFRELFYFLKRQHRVSGELHWSNIRQSYGPCNLGLELFEAMVHHEFYYSTIIVEKAEYREWNGPDQEEGFYKVVSLLLKDLCGRRLGRGEHRVLIDERSDSYPRHDEVLEIIGNRQLVRMADAGKIRGVTKVRSDEEPGVQAVDFMTGAIRHARELYLTRGRRACQPGKLAVIQRMADFIGWPALHHDTMPRGRTSRRLNIWHFPTPCRGKPGSLPICVQGAIRLVTREDIRRLQRHHSGLGPGPRDQVRRSVRPVPVGTQRATDGGRDANGQRKHPAG